MNRKHKESTLLLRKMIYNGSKNSRSFTMEQENIKRMPTHCGDKTCPSCVIAGDYIYLAHHAGGFEKRDIKYQMRAVFERVKNTLAATGATLSDMVQIHLYLYNLSDFDGAIKVFNQFFSPDLFCVILCYRFSFPLFLPL